MLAVYLLTLNRWVSMLDLPIVARESGWIWVPNLNNAVYYFFTFPLRLLPSSDVPIALNIFSALCATATLWLLTRSVGLLPHDRTEAQAARERNDFGLLTLKSAWFPPVLAAALCALQLTFWTLATNGGFVMFDLLLFALVIWLLLEYRQDMKDWRLYLSAAIAGAGIAEGPSMTGFFPLYFVAIVWVRGLAFFNWKFLGRMTLCGFLGLLFVAPLPILAEVTGKFPWTFIEVLKLTFMPQFHVLKIYFLAATNPAGVFEDLLLPLFISLMPLLVLSIRWKIGDSSRLGSALANLTFHSIHAIFLFVCIWLAFDPPFSPREKGFGLTLYYLISLSAGYYAGYFLLIFGRKHPRAGGLEPAAVKLFNTVVILTVWALGILAIAGLIYKNGPLIGIFNNESVRQYASLATSELPKEGAIVLSDDVERLYLAQAQLTRDGNAKNYLLLDTESLLYPQYHRYLHRLSPQKWPLLISEKQTKPLNPVGMVGMLSMLSRSNELYYLHPSFGYYFEAFYAEPHGLVYKLRELPTETLLPPPADKSLVAANEAFWAKAQAQVLDSIEHDPAPTATNGLESFADRELEQLHIPHEPDVNAAFIRAYCSRSLDFWGVELQRAGDLADAAQTFTNAVQLNPDNVVAQINLGFCDELRHGVQQTVDLTQATPDRLGKFDTIAAAITQDGPFDEPSFCFEYGRALMDDNGFYRQAVAPLERVRELAPNFLPARLLLARIYGLNHMPNRLLDVLREPLDHPDTFSFEEGESTEVHVLAGAAYFQKNELEPGSRLFEAEISRNPGNGPLLLTIARIYMGRGMYTNALEVANQALTSSPENPNWLYMKGYLDNQLGKYDDAITSLSRVMSVQKENADALFQRANAYLHSGNLAAAQADYQKLQQWQTNSYLAADGLGEIAWRQHDTNEVVRDYQIYMANAPTNAPDMKTIADRLHELSLPGNK